MIKVIHNRVRDYSEMDGRVDDGVDGDGEGGA